MVISKRIKKSQFDDEILLDLERGTLRDFDKRLEQVILSFIQECESLAKGDNPDLDEEDFIDVLWERSVPIVEKVFHEVKFGF
jgi:hypothetical protein